MRIALINASPKFKESACEVLLGDLKTFLPENCETIELCLRKPQTDVKVISELTKADVWIFAYPLYFDGLPGHMLSCLMQIAETDAIKEDKKVYGIANCGFYEGKQNVNSLNVLENWCNRYNLSWCGGVGVGAGGCINTISEMKPTKALKKPIGKALSCLAKNIANETSAENLYTSVGLPRGLYKFLAEISWRSTLKKNGQNPKDIAKQITD